jgi:hypothetical protein
MHYLCWEVSWGGRSFAAFGGACSLSLESERSRTVMLRHLEQFQHSILSVNSIDSSLCFCHSISSQGSFRIGAKTKQPLLANPGKKPLNTNFRGWVVSVAVILRSNANRSQVHWRLPIWLCEKIVAWVGGNEPESIET